MVSEDMPSAEKERIAILGIGRGGSRIADSLKRLPQGGVTPEIAVADTDIRTLEALSGIIQIPLGDEWGCRHGCGGDAELGERAAAASAAELRAFIQDAKLLLVIAALGGGTGTGALKVVARLARETDVTAFFIVTLPFVFEGNWRRRQAEAALKPLRDLTEAVVVIQNDALFSTLPADTPAPIAFGMADEMLAQAASGLAAVAKADWMLAADFPAIKALLRQYPGICNLGFGAGYGKNAWQEAMESFLQCPLVGGPETLSNADGAVLTLMTGADLSVGELQNCLSTLQQYFHANARVLVGACTNPSGGDRIQLTGLLCRSQQTPASLAAQPNGEPAKTVPTTQNAAPASRRQTDPKAAVQAELPLQEHSLGIFAGTAPTTVRGENLDIPTFQRRGIHIDAGD